ncbi:MAG TPA: hypothetical protein VFG15_30335 [Amycolatopsis sp.]|nr:hypothetical protein [Amycolatopsis sp.]
MPFDTRDSRETFGYPVRAVHVGPDGRGDREIRAWRNRFGAEQWLTKHGRLEDWEITRCRNIAWGGPSNFQPWLDGRSLDWPTYDTPDGNPHVPGDDDGPGT